MTAVFDVYQLGRYAQLVAGLADAAFKHRAHAEFSSDRSDVLRFALVSEGGGPRGDAQASHVYKVAYDLLRDPVTEITLVLFRAHVGKGEDSNRWLGRRSRRLPRDHRDQAISPARNCLNDLRIPGVVAEGL